MKACVFRSLCAAAVLAFATNANAALINEFEPNPDGTDPSTGSVELIGTPLESFTGFLTFIDTDGGGALGIVNNSVVSVDGSFDANGLLVVDIPFDAENPSYTLVLSSANPGTGDLDTDNDNNLDDPSVFGTAFDAIGIIDTAGDARNYAAQLGGEEFSIANEFELAFRDGTTGEWVGVDIFGPRAFTTTEEIPGAFVVGGGDFTAPTFGAVNPTVIPEPGAALLVLLGVAFAGAARMRSQLG